MWRVGAHARIALGTLCVFNALILTALGGVAWRYVDGVAGPASAIVLWVGAAGLWWLARRLRRGTEWS